MPFQTQTQGQTQLPGQQPMMPGIMPPMQQPTSYVGSTSSKNNTTSFENEFAEMAMDQLQSTVPELISKYSTFKIIEADPENGKAIGNFIFILDTGTIYAPVILNSDQLEPIDIMYVKELRRFLPFSKSWIDYLGSMTEPDLGYSDPQLPRSDDSSPRGVQLHDLLMPPRTTRKPVIGRSSYASDASHEKDAFLNFVDEIPNAAK